jgi:hypothetical protein
MPFIAAQLIGAVGGLRAPLTLASWRARLLGISADRASGCQTLGS